MPSKNTPTPTPSSYRQPNHSYPCPPHPANPREDRERGDRAGKIKHTPGMYQHTNMASAQALRSVPLLFLQDVWGSALVTRPDTNHRISDISLRPLLPPNTTSTPPLWSHWECFVKTQRRRARPVVHYVKYGEYGYRADWPLGPLGASSAPTRATPPRGKRHVVPVRSCPP